MAAQSLLSTTKPIGQLRGRTYRFGEDRFPVIVMYHPAYFLRSPLQKRKGWDDLVRLAGDALRRCGGRPVNAVARELPDVGFRPMHEADLDEVLSIEREAYEFSLVAGDLPRLPPCRLPLPGARAGRRG